MDLIHFDKDYSSKEGEKYNSGNENSRCCRRRRTKRVKRARNANENNHTENEIV